MGSFFNEIHANSAFFAKADAFFKEYVNNGRVDYARLHQNPQPLNKLMENATTVKVDKANAEIYQAFWINAYNLAVIKA